MARSTRCQPPRVTSPEHLSRNLDRRPQWHTLTDQVVSDRSASLRAVGWDLQQLRISDTDCRPCSAATSSIMSLSPIADVGDPRHLRHASRCVVLKWARLSRAALFEAAVTAMSAQGQTRREAGTQSLRSRAIRDSGVADGPCTTKAVVKRSWLHGFACSGGSYLRLPPRPEHSGDVWNALISAGTTRSHGS
jgi:hypothetical protein